MDNVTSHRLPGGNLIAAVLDRNVMALADRGGASGLVGQRWADLCADHAAAWPGTNRPVPGAPGEPFLVHRVLRLDDIPAIAAEASRRALQNPDLLLAGERDGHPVLQAADAKFSVETAREKQVSPAVVEALLGIGPLIDDLIGNLHAEGSPVLVDGVFLSPDFPLTHLMLKRKIGIVRTTVRPDQVIVLPAPAGPFFAPLEGAGLIAPLAAVDGLPISPDQSLLASLYYFRLARAGVGCWLDATGPLLTFNDKIAVDLAAVETEVRGRLAAATSALDLILRWNTDVQSVRSARTAVDQVTAVPLLNRDLRELIARVAKETESEAPSVNQVRRRVGAWYRGRLRDQFGPLLPPVADLPATLSQVGRAAAELTPELQIEAERIVRELIAQGVTAISPKNGQSPPPVATPVRPRRPY